MKTPDKTNLTPMTYGEAKQLYVENGSKPFSFVAAPYGVLKTIQWRGTAVVAAPPSASF